MRKKHRQARTIDKVAKLRAMSRLPVQLHGFRDILTSCSLTVWRLVYKVICLSDRLFSPVLRLGAYDESDCKGTKYF